MPDLEKSRVSQAELSRILQLSEEAVSASVRRGKFTKERDGKIILGRALKSYFASLQAAKLAANDAEVKSAELRRDASRAGLEKRKLARLTRETLPTERIEECYIG